MISKLMLTEAEVAALMRHREPLQMTRIYKSGEGMAVFRIRRVSDTGSSIYAELQELFGHDKSPALPSGEAALEWLRTTIARKAPDWIDPVLDGRAEWTVYLSPAHSEAEHHNPRAILVEFLRDLQKATLLGDRGHFNIVVQELKEHPAYRMLNVRERNALLPMFNDAGNTIHSHRPFEGTRIIANAIRLVAAPHEELATGSTGPAADTITIFADLSEVPPELILRFMSDLDALHRAVGGGGLEIRGFASGALADEAMVPA